MSLRWARGYIHGDTLQFDSLQFIVSRPVAIDDGAPLPGVRRTLSPGLPSAEQLQPMVPPHPYPGEIPGSKPVQSASQNLTHFLEGPSRCLRARVLRWLSVPLVRARRM